MGRMSRRKGSRGELEAAAEIARLFHVEARRGRQYCGDPSAPDIRTAIEGVYFEIKRCEALRLYAALEQASNDAGANVPLVLHRANRKPWIFVGKLDDLPRLALLLYPVLSEDRYAK